MARKKTTKQPVNSINQYENASLELTETLAQAFDALIEKNFGYARPPKPLVTPTGIRHLDALLGGGIVSSSPVMISSTPESGKSTFAFQFSKNFLATHQNSITVYLDIEGSGNELSDSKYQISRLETFGLNDPRFRYEQIVLPLSDVFNLMDQLIKIKKQVEEKRQCKFNIMLIWDSIAATPSSAAISAEDANKTIGKKARELTFLLEKFTPELKYNQITFLCIDQVRANLKIEQYAAKEQSVGEFKDFKAASGINALNHLTSQWLFLSKRSQITLADNIGIDGWYLDVYTEKCKYAPSKLSVRLVFDKNYGIDKFWSEFTFLSQLTPSEQKYFKKPDNLSYPLCISSNGSRWYLQVINPDTGEVLYTSKQFYRKDAKELYNTDQEFRQWFDYAVEMSIFYRIQHSLFRVAKMEQQQTNNNEEELHSPVLEETDKEVLDSNNPEVNNDTTVVNEPAIDDNVEDVSSNTPSDVDDNTYQPVF